MILQREISKLANRLYREALATYGKKQAFRIPETTIERDYCLAWLLSALSKHEALATALAFKGGTALRRVHFGEYRFSEDLDFTLVTEIPLEQIFSELDVLFDVLAEESGIRFSRKSGDPVRHARNDTFYLEYQGPLPSKGSVKVDVTRGETLVFELERKPVLQTYPEFSDLPDDRRIPVYSFPEVAVEKTLAVTDNARREPRDLYDLWYLADRRSVADCAGDGRSAVAKAWHARGSSWRCTRTAAGSRGKGTGREVKNAPRIPGREFASFRWVL